MIKKRSLMIAVLAFTVCSFAAQDTASKNSTNPWKYSVLTNLTLTFNSYSDNWAGSEYGSMAWAWTFNGTAEKQFTKRLSDKNTLKLAFGQTATQKKNDNGNKKWQKFQKSSDLIDFESVLRFTLQSFVDPYISVRLVSQFADERVPGYRCEGNPLTIYESFGAIRDLAKNDRIVWSARIGGAIRQNIDRNDYLDTSLHVDDFTNDGGLEFVTDLKTTTKDNRISYVSQLKVYEALFSSIADKYEGESNESYWRHPDVSWDNTIGVMLLKYITLNIHFEALYDIESDDNIRCRNTIGLSLSYSKAN